MRWEAGDWGVVIQSHQWDISQVAWDYRNSFVVVNHFIEGSENWGVSVQREALRVSPSVLQVIIN